MLTPEREKKLMEQLDWAARIIDSGMNNGTLRYDPLKWFADYHELKRSIEQNKPLLDTGANEKN